jgi:hypothetical protein
MEARQVLTASPIVRRIPTQMKGDPGASGDHLAAVVGLFKDLN